LYEAERRRADELQQRIEAVQPEHEALFTRYATAVEQIENLKGERKQIVMECDKLEASLRADRESAERAKKNAAEEADRLRREREAERVLQVSDVLISVSFEGASASLALRPWDTDLEGVVGHWLATQQRGMEMQSCLVRYLKHLEDTADAFPVHAQASLEEVQSRFGSEM